MSSATRSWDAKITYGFWRPIHAIREAATDPDPAWEPFATTPNHPEYPSAHSCVTAGLAEAGAEIVGRDRIELDISSTVTGTTRHYEHVRDVERDVQDARVFAGIHFRNSTDVGVKLGERVARWGSQHYFRPTHGKDGK
jgi:hypothetical protein